MRIIQRLQFLLTNAHASSTLLTYVASLKHVIICGTQAVPDLCQFWETFYQELPMKSPYQASIRGIRLRLVELQAEDSPVWKIGAEKLGRNREDSDGILNHQGLPYIPKIIRTELISKHHNDPLAGYFGIKKMRKLVTKKYY